MEYYFPGFPGIGKKYRDKNTGQNDTGSRDPWTEPLDACMAHFGNELQHADGVDTCVAHFGCELQHAGDVDTCVAHFGCEPQHAGGVDTFMAHFAAKF